MIKSIVDHPESTYIDEEELQNISVCQLKIIVRKLYKDAAEAEKKAKEAAKTTEDEKQRDFILKELMRFQNKESDPSLQTLNDLSSLQLQWLKLTIANLRKLQKERDSMSSGAPALHEASGIVDVFIAEAKETLGDIFYKEGVLRIVKTKGYAESTYIIQEHLLQLLRRLYFREQTLNENLSQVQQNMYNCQVISCLQQFYPNGVYVSISPSPPTAYDLGFTPAERLALITDVEQEQRSDLNCERQYDGGHSSARADNVKRFENYQIIQLFNKVLEELADRSRGRVVRGDKSYDLQKVALMMEKESVAASHHDRFACPLLREQCSGSKKSASMRLIVAVAESRECVHGWRCTQTLESFDYKGMTSSNETTRCVVKCEAALLINDYKQNVDHDHGVGKAELDGRRVLATIDLQFKDGITCIEARKLVKEAWEAVLGRELIPLGFE